MSVLPSQVDPHAVAAVFHGSAPAIDPSHDALSGFSPSQPLTAPLQRSRWTAREWRVTFIIATIVLVSVADLYLTLTYLHNGGMAEGNPIARWVMSLGCPWLLAVWKGGMVAFTCAILFAFKKRGSAELAAWVCCAAMAWLCVQWSSYVQDIESELQRNPQLTQVSSWVSFDKN